MYFDFKKYSSFSSSSSSSSSYYYYYYYSIPLSLRRCDASIGLGKDTAR
jgi:hypothetical protein